LDCQDWGLRSRALRLPVIQLPDAAPLNFPSIQPGVAFEPPLMLPIEVRALNDRRLTDLCRCFAVIAENKRKVAALVAEKR
jgi:hypothetical protein